MDKQIDSPFSQAITAERFVDFLEATSRDSVCQACGHDHFETINDHVDPSLAAIFRFGFGPPQGPQHGAVPSLVVGCSRCGWLRFHTFMAVWAWLQANPADRSSVSQDESNHDE